MEHLINRVQAYFNDNKQINYYSLEHMQGPTSIEEILLAQISPYTNTKVLDVGCGTGRISLSLAKRGSNVVAVDISKELLELGIQKAKKEDLNIKFLLLANTENLLSELQEQDEYEFIILFKVYSYIPTKRRRIAFLNKLFELVKPNGKVLMTQNIVPMEYYDEYMDEHYERMSKLYVGIEPGDTFPDGSGFVHWFKEQELEDELQATSFSIELNQNDSEYTGDGLLQMIVLKKDDDFDNGEAK